MIFLVQLALTQFIRETTTIHIVFSSKFTEHVGTVKICARLALKFFLMGQKKGRLKYELNIFDIKLTSESIHTLAPDNTI